MTMGRILVGVASWPDKSRPDDPGTSCSTGGWAAAVAESAVPRLELYPFKYRDRITGKWVRATHKLQVPALQRRYAEWEITGAPEIRHVTPGPIEHFNPFRPPASRACIAPMLLYMR
jgi:hypothetical protein